MHLKKDESFLKKEILLGEIWHYQNQVQNKKILENICPDTGYTVYWYAVVSLMNYFSNLHTAQQYTYNGQWSLDIVRGVVLWYNVITA